MRSPIYDIRHPNCTDLFTSLLAHRKAIKANEKTTMNLLSLEFLTLVFNYTIRFHFYIFSFCEELWKKDAEILPMTKIRNHPDNNDADKKLEKYFYIKGFKIGKRFFLLEFI